MEARTLTPRPGAAPAVAPPFQRFAGRCALLAGLAGLGYAGAFVLVARSAPAAGALLSALFLLLGGLLTTAALVGLYERLHSAASGFALLGFLLAVVGSIGALVHGGYDLATAIGPPAPRDAALPSAIDPRGLLTFGLTGLGLGTLSWLIVRSGALPRGLGYLGYALATLLVVLYLGRLVVFDPASPLVLGPAVLAGFLLNPAWYLWLGVALGRGNGG